jgi:uncharacterized membrane protein YeiH
MTPLMAFDYAGVAVFAASGALAASRKQLDLIGFLFFAALTGIGGGTVRDLVLGATPVFWVADPTHLWVCGAVAVVVFFTAHLVESRYRLLLWLDAIGLAAYAVMGAAKGLAMSGSPTIGIVTGVMTATVGGILRDVVAEEPSVLLLREVYVTAVMAGAGVFVLLTVLAMPAWLAAGSGFGVAFLLRAGAILHGWTVPAYRGRAGRRPEDIP